MSEGMEYHADGNDLTACQAQMETEIAFLKGTPKAPLYNDPCAASEAAGKRMLSALESQSQAAAVTPRAALKSPTHAHSLTMTPLTHRSQGIHRGLARSFYAWLRLCQPVG